MKPILKRQMSILAFSATVLLAVAAFAEPALTPKADDLWVMAGDSITAQRLHTNYIEAFYRTRYPSLNLRFRNSGIGGNRTGSVLARFDYDVAAWKPTIVSIELGMNDVGDGDDPAKHIGARWPDVPNENPERIVETYALPDAALAQVPGIVAEA